MIAPRLPQDFRDRLGEVVFAKVFKVVDRGVHPDMEAEFFENGVVFDLGCCQRAGFYRRELSGP